jgi:hypothetical protein
MAGGQAEDEVGVGAEIVSDDARDQSRGFFGGLLDDDFHFESVKTLKR